ncbi:c-type cytochrome, partial [Congregibacter sp.]|uniref:c-type cytochrome n=1 Tax=Congregibacter sp. TaxID=2744308 RepID=UPI0039E378B9
MKISLRRSRAIAAIMLCGSGVALAQSPAEIVYADQCASCHSASLRGSAHGSPLTGVAFVSKWKDRSAQELFDYVRTQMPPGQTASLSLHQHRQLTEFLIASNAQDLGDSQLVSTSVELPEQEEGQVEWSGSDAIDQLAKSAGNFTNQTLEDYQAVSSKMLATPPKGDWLSWRRTLDGHAHSPLKQINRSNV